MRRHGRATARTPGVALHCGWPRRPGRAVLDPGRTPGHPARRACRGPRAPDPRAGGPPDAPRVAAAHRARTHAAAPAGDDPRETATDAAALERVGPLQPCHTGSLLPVGSEAITLSATLL